jgi:hypothetical protein
MCVSFQSDLIACFFQGDLELSLNVDLNKSDQHLDTAGSSAGSASPESKANESFSIYCVFYSIYYFQKKGKKGGKKAACLAAATTVLEHLESPTKKGNKYAHLSGKKKH